jgi:hypothetical protein
MPVFPLVASISVSLRSPDHRKRWPVLHRARRIIAFELAENDVVAATDVVVYKPHQLDERRIADRVCDRFVGHVGSGH